VEAAAALDNVHIIPTYGVLREGATVAIIMAYAPGGSLGDTLRAGDKVPLPLAAGVVARIVRQLAGALQTAHGAGLVHGDLKPNNIFVRTSPQGTPLAVVGDFGQAILTQAAATLAANGGAGPEQTSWIAEQLRYAAPEQLRGPAVPASDQYALAAVAYHLLTGRAPYAGDARALLATIPHENVTPPAQLNPAIPMEAERTLLRGLAKQPEARFPSVELFADLLDETLAVGTLPGGPGVTEQMSSLAAARSGVNPAASRGASAPFTYDDDLLPYASGTTGAMRLPADAPPRARWPLALVAGIAVVALLFTCVLTTGLFGGNGILPLSGNLSRYLGPNVAPTQGSSADPTFQAQAQAAEGQLASATAGTPVLSDSFANNNAHWATTSTSSIHDGHLYITNPTGATPALLKTPGLSSLASVTARVDIAHTQGAASDLAGLCFYIASDTKGRQSFYTYLVSSEGRYEFWLYNGSWTFLTGGYSAALKLGEGQTNTLAALAPARQGYADLFANGHFVAKVHLAANGPTSGNAGMLVLNLGSAAAFTQYAVYNAA
jgi:hypothetical protein